MRGALSSYTRYTICIRYGFIGKFLWLYGYGSCHYKSVNKKEKKTWLVSVTGTGYCPLNCGSHSLAHSHSLSLSFCMGMCVCRTWRKRAWATAETERKGKERERKKERDKHFACFSMFVCILVSAKMDVWVLWNQQGRNRLQLHTSFIIFTTYTCHPCIDSGKNDRGWWQLSCCCCCRRRLHGVNYVATVMNNLTFVSTLSRAFKLAECETAL